MTSNKAFIKRSCEVNKRFTRAPYDDRNSYLSLMVDIEVVILYVKDNYGVDYKTALSNLSLCVSIDTYANIKLNSFSILLSKRNQLFSASIR